MNAAGVAHSIAGAVSAAREAAHVVGKDDGGIDLCPTCMSYGGDPLPGDPPAAELKECPTCGVASVEWTLAWQIDEQVTKLGAFDHLLGVVLDESDGESH